MPGRQSHGRPLLAASGPKQGKPQPRTFKKSRAKAASKALDAFALAAEELGPERPMRGVRMRDLEERPEPSQKKRGHDDDEDGEEDFDEDDEDEAPQKKRAKRDGDEFEGFSGDSSDSEEWHVGVGEDDEDSELDSDEAFGESDEEKYDSFSFGGSSSMKKPKKKTKARDDSDEEEEEEDEDDLESLGSDAIDLATALDQYSDSEEGEEVEEGSDDEEDEASTDGDDESEESDEEDPEKLDALQKMIAGFGGDGSDDEEGAKASSGKTKLSLADLGLAGVKDPHIKKSLKLMNKEEKATKPGAAKKLAVPLAKRQEDKILRAAAYEKTNETLDRWIDTVKHNRRADHLMFPLAQNAHDLGLDSNELQPITQKTAGTELESTILAIMEESGLGPTVNKAQKESGGLEGQNQLSTAEQKEIARQRRRERELHSREMARAKRIKKIKSKAYRRIHRKELAKEQQAEHEALLEAGEIDSEEEREAQDRRRAQERMGTRHRESKWAKLGKKAGRAVWDDDFRAGLTDMARRKEELRRRVEGRANGSEDEDSDVSMGDTDDKCQLLSELDRAAAYSDDDEPKSALMQMKFMQRGEELRKKENDELVAQIRREMDSDGEEDSAEEMDIGRRQYGMGNPPLKMPGDQAKKAKKAAAESASEPVIFKEDLGQSEPATSRTETSEPVASAPGAAGAWSRVGVEGRKSKKAASKGRVEELDLSNAAMLATKSSKPKTKAQTQTAEKDADDSGDDSDAIHLPMAIRDQELIKRAFAGEDVVGEFRREKAEIEQEDDDKEIDNTLPGWGSWVGEGVSAREQKRHKGRFVTKVEGVKKQNRKDYRLKDVIVSERRVKKNDKYLATVLPHPFESHQQYERSLRMPVGPEWSTKEVFQGATKPRVIIKQGIIAPMSRPMV